MEPEVSHQFIPRSQSAMPSGTLAQSNSPPGWPIPMPLGLLTPDPAIVGAGLARGGWPRPGAGYWKHSAGLWKSTARGPTFRGT